MGKQAPGAAVRRLNLARVARLATPHTSVRLCGSVRKGAATADLWRGDGGSVVVHGLNRCGSPWECPTCATGIGKDRARELDRLANAHRATGGELYHLTLTVQHGPGLPLKPLRAHIANSWRRLVNGKPWKRRSDAVGLVGFVRALDTTVGGNGWHPHLHILLLTAAPLGARDLATWRRWIRERWIRAVTRPVPGFPEGRALLGEPSRKHGVKLKRAVLASYLAEASILWSDELASHTMKEARAPGHYTPWQILQRLTLDAFKTAKEQAQAVTWWMEWAAGMRGARQLTFSRGLRERYGLRADDSDAAALDAQISLDLGEAPRLRLSVPAWEWNHVVIRDTALHAFLLDVVSDAAIPDADVQELADAAIAARRAAALARRAA